MIGYLEGKIIKYSSDGILLLVGNVGYEILLSANVRHTLKDDYAGLYIYYHQTERQPKPVLIGFDTEKAREFFELFITVDSIGPLKAVKALDRPAGEIARAIDEKNAAFLAGLSGIGKRSAEKIIATLNGRVDAFLPDVPDLSDDDDEKETADMEMPPESLADDVIEVLVSQLGHTRSDARKMVLDAFKKNSGISTPEQLLNEVYRKK